jgi:UDP-N-acetylglucosamine 3-dehydrogenase
MTFKNIADNTSINIAFLGCGFATKNHSKTLKKFKNVRRFYASRSAEKAVEYQQKFKGAGHFGSYEDAINSPEINTIFVATPPDSHLELTLQAMRAGKHVIVEKPPFFNSTDFDIITNLQKETQTQVMIAENYFYKPNLQRLRKLIASDVIGDIKFLYFNATKKQTTGDWRDEKTQSGGGSLFEGGIHWINFISNMGLEVDSVSGFQPGEVLEMDRSMQIVAKYKEGAIGTLLYSWEVNALFKGLRLSKLYGTKGSISFESNGIFIFVRGRKWKFILPGFSDIGGSKGMFQDFFKALRNGEEPDFNLALAKRDLVMIEEVYRSARA